MPVSAAVAAVSAGFGAEVAGASGAWWVASAGRSVTPPLSERASTAFWARVSAIMRSIAMSGVGGSAPKKRSSAARSRKYSAMSVIAEKGSSNPSNVQENAP